MTLSWLMKLRITAVLCLGAGLIGFLAWPMAKPVDPFGGVLFGGLGFLGALSLLGLAVLVGALGYFIAWPYGEKIGILAVPAGLSIWAIRSGSMADEILLYPSAAGREVLFSSFRSETFLWLIIVAAGFAGVFLAKKIASRSENAVQKEDQGKPKLNVYLNAAVAVALSGVIVQFCISALAQNVNIMDKTGIFVAQPAAAQILFAVVVSFGAAGFAVKKFLNGSYIWPMIASGFVSLFAIVKYLRSENLLEHSVQNLPVVFFPNAVLSILPLQMVAFGCLGAVWGYWLAVRYDHWRLHELG